MKFVVKNISGENLINLMRKIGYHYAGESRDKTQLTFTRSLGPNSYPRFHIYLKENKETGEIFLNLHLDQKKPIYKGAPAHSAEYEGEVVEKEAERIKNVLNK
ncbi:hypothetical protein J7K42_01800 [bacterium]|nr:hypothetical protein [bacterium]